MAKRYVFVRLPVTTYQLYEGIQQKMKNDLEQYLGKPIPLPMTKVFRAVASHEFNEKIIQVDMEKLAKFAKQRRENALF